jgi:ABC-2 type transport system permease protein
MFKFELQYQRRNPLFYAIPFVFFCLGLLMGAVTGVSFPNIHVNSPYQISYLLGVLSLAGIFAATLVVAQSVLREKETKFDQLIFAAPIHKLYYLGARFISLSGISIFALFLALAGLFVGQHFAVLPEARFGAFNLVNYTWPFIVLVVPNLLLCTTMLCSAAWLSKSKLVIYITGLFIYILYITGAIFSNSPLIAGSAPLNPAQASFFAKADPFGMAAFFEQTRYYTAEQRNTLSLSLSGDLLINRLIWLMLSFLLLVFAYRSYTFRTANKAIRVLKAAPAFNTRPYRQIRVKTNNAQVLWSFWRMDLQVIFRGIPFLLIFILWTALFGIELSNAVSGNARTGEPYATSALLFSTIKDILPSFTLLVLLFYSSELLWKSREAGFAAMENATPYPRGERVFAHVLALSVLPVLLIIYSSLLAIICQLIKGYAILDVLTYGSLFYYVGLPLIINILLMLKIQSGIENKYAGLAVATVVILLLSTNLGTMVGLRYSLLRFGVGIPIALSEMAGFDAYNKAFFWQMLYCAALATALLLGRRKLAIGFALIAVSAGIYIVLHTNYRTEKSADDWKQGYEKAYKKYEKLPQLSITDVRTAIDLYPSANNYKVSGLYTLVNKQQQTIDSLLIYIDSETTLEQLAVSNAHLLRRDLVYGHYWYKFLRPIKPGDSTQMTFRFVSGWAGFGPHTAFNSILHNGSFIRISNYYPSLGYESGNELGNELKRRERHLPPQAPLKKLEAERDARYDYGFINYQALVSTDAGQTAVSSGNLTQQYVKAGRPYSRYVSDRPMPFRFAVSSATYQVQKSIYNNIPIEVYYQHPQNVAKLIVNAKRALTYMERNIGAYPHRVVRFAEVSSFATGFAATSYPGTVYMKEDGGFFNNISSARQQDVINELAGHELSHQWWGCTGMAPEYKEGGWVLTETLAKFTELMLYRQMHPAAAPEIMRTYLDLYLSERSFSPETPLYKTTYDTPHIPYDKGMLVMYQLCRLIGEEKVNAALKDVYDHHRFPLPPPETTDLINALYIYGPKERVDELFKQIITYDNKIINAKVTRAGSGYRIDYNLSLQKYRENGMGKRVLLPFNELVELELTDDQGHTKIYKVNGSGSLQTNRLPVKILLDPNIDFIDTFTPDNEKNL